MARYSLSRAADDKIAAIYEYSVLQFGERQADKYFLGLHDIFEALAERPNLGPRRDEPDYGGGLSIKAMSSSTS
jgi:plasmid stabilization system protein ParE